MFQEEGNEVHVKDIEHAVNYLVEHVPEIEYLEF